MLDTNLTLEHFEKTEKKVTKTILCENPMKEHLQYLWT